MTESTAAPKAKKPKFERFTTRRGTVADFVSEALDALEELGSEMREAYDNAPENLQQSDVNTRRDEAASTLELLGRPEPQSSILGELDCETRIDAGKMYRGRPYQSRATRCANACAMLRAAADAVRNFESNNGETIDELDDDATAEEREEFEAKLADAGISEDALADHNEAVEEAGTLADEIEAVADEAENVDFPGMYG